MKPSICLNKQKILIINGPNLNMLGVREIDIYGKNTLGDLAEKCKYHAAKYDLLIDFRQTNYEGEIIDWIQEAIDNFHAIIINPAGYSHSSVSILDALKIFQGLIVEVHLSDITKREYFRKKSITSLAANKIIYGKKEQGYLDAIDFIYKN